MILVDILPIAEFILPPAYTLKHQTMSGRFFTEIEAPKLSRLTPCKQ